MNLYTIRRTIIVTLFLLMHGCAAHQSQPKSPIVMTQSTQGAYILENPVTIKATNAEPTILRQGTTWQPIGQLEEGLVLKSRDQVVVVNSFDVFEAMIVVMNDQVVGYYVPSNGKFVKTNPEKLSLHKKEQ